ncbi:response regulator transcription factor [Prolixibacteraceae bacterium JC049]|nr:response regulator transcription factor [Prolixibacteraceae bacterium JC049]
MKIIVIDDHPPLRKTNSEVLSSLFPNAEIKTFTYPSKALKDIMVNTIDLVLIDLQYNNKENGIDFIREVRQKRDFKAIAYTSHNDSGILKNVRSAQFTSYLNKDVEEEELIRTVLTVVQNNSLQFYESESYLKHKRAINDTEDRFFCTDFEKESALTQTEKRVVQNIAENEQSNNEELADMMNIHVTTLKKHITHIYKKLSLKSKDGVRAFWYRTSK